MGRRLTGVAVAALAVLAAGCGENTNYQGGVEPTPPEGGTRAPGVNISSLNQLRSAVIRITDKGFAPDSAAVQVTDPVIWQNRTTTRQSLRKLTGPGAAFASGPLEPEQSYQREFPKPGKVIVRLDTNPPRDMVVTINK